MSLLTAQQSAPQPVSADAGCDDSVCCRLTTQIHLTPQFGSRRTNATLRYLLLGPADADTIIVQGGISAGRDVSATEQRTDAGWWQPLVGPGRAIDTRRVRVLCIDWLDAKDLGTDCISTTDQADALAALLAQLRIPRLRAFVGSSYGAMVGLAFAARHGQVLDKLIAIAGAHRPHPLASAQRAVQRGILRFGQRLGHEPEAVALARQLALTTYRGSNELAERFDGPATRDETGWHLPVESWLRHNGDKFARNFSAQRYHSLSESIDLHRVDPRNIHVPVHLIGIASDRLVPLADLCELQRSLPTGASLDVIDSRCGHDGFLVEHAQIEPLLTSALQTNDACRPFHATTSFSVSALPARSA